LRQPVHAKLDMKEPYILWNQ